MTKTVYIVLTETGSLLSRAIKWYTKDRYNHVSIAFDEQLNEMYSFGRKRENNPWIGGFTQENVHGELLRYANCAIYSYTISDEQFEHLKIQIAHFKANEHLYRYNFLGLLCIAFRIRWKRHNAYFCSQFIATLFENAQIETKLCTYFIRPTEFKHLPNVQFCYKGQMYAYINKVNGEEEMVCSNKHFVNC